ncbi:hypothetical protein GH714_032354 [Hevea brasiliensis]|uniref:Uncharacterized protein n=1 Tax=Hevea brasiliensis TaxID=3981 RepID=A0A6A6L1K5_HEVBR|nr:hypothetical protein GH714_032354 [Hevea brasiliensis]
MWSLLCLVKLMDLGVDIIFHHGGNFIEKEDVIDIVTNIDIGLSMENENLGDVKTSGVNFDNCDGNKFNEIEPYRNVNDITQGVITKTRFKSIGRPPQNRKLSFGAKCYRKPIGVDMGMGPYYDDSSRSLIYKSTNVIHDGTGGSQNIRMHIGTSQQTLSTNTVHFGAVRQIGVFNEESVGQSPVNLGFKAAGLKWAGHPYVTSKQLNEEKERKIGHSSKRAKKNDN